MFGMDLREIMWPEQVDKRREKTSAGVQARHKGRQPVGNRWQKERDLGWLCGDTEHEPGLVS